MYSIAQSMLMCDSRLTREESFHSGKGYGAFAKKSKKFKKFQGLILGFRVLVLGFRVQKLGF